ncbi:DUF427-domain-containing protein [Aspergillus taichungensis]|uniref:DUF427-domain-containing protein n=1 Tax=Aspergillus taichungensis TaxID=482145 RepID=A0A2J5HIV6_9EURO|nr:DUF427-domain-containing protein [Aspergillus taichungensis]
MPLATASLNGTTLAETDTWETVEGNIYFPPESIKDKSLFKPSDMTTYCPWKGDASYYNVVIGDKTIRDGAWYYAHPYDAAIKIKNHIAFYKDKVDIKSA